MSDLSLEDLKGLRAALEQARFRGVKSVTYDYEGGSIRTDYASDAEMKAALADLDRKINRAAGASPVTTVRLFTSKGL